MHSKPPIATLPGGHQVVVVQEAHEGLNAAPARRLFLAHSPGYSPRVSLYPGDQRVAEGLVLVLSALKGLNDNSLLARVAPAQHNHDFVGFHNLPHLAD